MMTLLVFLKNFIFPGVVGNTTYDIAKHFWSKAFSKGLEELYLDAFSEAVENQRPQLEKYGSPVSLDREALSKALRHDLYIDLDSTNLTFLSANEFVRNLAPLLEQNQVITIGRHNLSTVDYEQLVSNLIRSTYSIFRQRVLENEDIFNDVLLSEIHANRQQLSDVRAYLVDRFNLTLGKIDLILERTEVLPRIAEQTDLLPKISRDIEKLLKKELPPPFQLPADISHFVGRTQEIERLIQLFEQQSGSVLLICGLAGMGGIGKSSLAIHIAHRLSHLFPDGILWANLREEKPFDVLAKFARAYGFDLSHELSLESRTAQLRSILSGKRTLLILDNAQHDDDIRPLLPSSPTAAVIVTSRQHLASLHDTPILDLDVLTESEAYELLEQLIGKERVKAESNDANRTCHLVGYLPLGVSIAGGRLTTRRHWSLKDFADRLSNERRRLTELEIGYRPEHNIRAAFNLSYQELDPLTKRFFCLLSVFSGPDFGTEASAALTKTTFEKAEDFLEMLSNLALVRIGQKERYRIHDLLRLFGNERLSSEWSNRQVTSARLRLTRYYTDYATIHAREYDLLEIERENILANISWSRDSYEKTQHINSSRVRELVHQGANKPIVTL
jgi:hypothetical protein